MQSTKGFSIVSLNVKNKLVNYLIKITLVLITCLIFSPSYLEAAKKEDKKEKERRTDGTW